MGHLYGLETESGEPLWSYRTGREITSSPALGGSRLYVASYDNKLHSLEAAGGEKLGEFVARGDILSSPALAGGRGFFGTYDGYF